MKRIGSMLSITVTAVLLLVGARGLSAQGGCYECYWDEHDWNCAPGPVGYDMCEVLAKMSVCELINPCTHDLEVALDGSATRVEPIASKTVSRSVFFVEGRLKVDEFCAAAVTTRVTKGAAAKPEQRVAETPRASALTLEL